jgi:circadian clock protein KaiC
MHLTQLILSSIKRIGAKRLVIDSLSVLAMQYTNEFYVRQGLQGMVHALESQHCTSLLISETSEIQIPLDWYVTSGIILLHHIRREDTMERAIHVLKMRGIKHSEQILPIRISDSGMQVMHPRLIP